MDVEQGEKMEIAQGVRRDLERVQLVIPDSPEQDRDAAKQKRREDQRDDRFGKPAIVLGAVIHGVIDEAYGIKKSMVESAGISKGYDRLRLRRSWRFQSASAITRTMPRWSGFFG